MATNARTATTSRISMSSMRKTALVAGVLYLLTFLSSIPAVFLQGPVLTDPNFIIGGAGADYPGAPRRPVRHRQQPHRHRDRGRALCGHQAPEPGLRHRLRELAAVRRRGPHDRRHQHPVDRDAAAAGRDGRPGLAPGQHAADARHRSQLDLRARDRRPRPQRRPARLDHVQVAPRPSRDPGDRAHRRAAVHLLDHRLHPRRHRRPAPPGTRSASPRSSSGSCRSACG